MSTEYEFASSSTFSQNPFRSTSKTAIFDAALAAKKFAFALFFTHHTKFRHPVSQDFDCRNNYYPKIEMEYPETGNGGMSKKTKAGYGNGIKHFEIFLKTKGMKVSTELTESEICDIKLWREFATFLCYHATCGDGVLISQGTGKQYMSTQEML